MTHQAQIHQIITMLSKAKAAYIVIHSDETSSGILIGTTPQPHAINLITQSLDYLLENEMNDPTTPQVLSEWLCLNKPPVVTDMQRN